MNARTWWALTGALLLAAHFCEADTAPDFPAKLEPVAPFDALRAAATAGGIPLENIDPPVSGSAVSPGDCMTALLTLHKKGRLPMQWLVCFQATNGAKQVAREETSPMVMYTSTGNKFEFARSLVGLRVRTIGPFAGPEVPHQPVFQDKCALLSVNKDYLSIGFDRGAAAAFRWDNFNPKQDADDFMRSFSFGHAPFGSSQVDYDRKLAARLSVTPEEERSVVGWIPALTSYFDTVQQTPNLRSILMEVMDKPSFWSVVRNLGVTASMGLSYDNVGPLSPAVQGFPSSTPIYSLSAVVNINDRQALNLTMIAAAPRPPLLICGGIVGLLAENPEDADNYLTVRVVSAHCGSGAK